MYVFRKYENRQSVKVLHILDLILCAARVTKFVGAKKRAVSVIVYLL